MIFLGCREEGAKTDAMMVNNVGQCLPSDFKVVKQMGLETGFVEIHCALGLFLREGGKSGIYH